MTVLYISKDRREALEHGFRAVGACGDLVHVPAVMATDAFPPTTPNPVRFTRRLPALEGTLNGSRFRLAHFPPPPRSAYSCPSPTLPEIGILLSHLRAMAMAVRLQRTGRAGPVLVVEDDVDLRLVPRWVGALPGAHASGRAQCTRAPLLDAMVAALPAGWGVLQVALISTSANFKRLRQRLGKCELVVPHETLVGTDGKNEGWSTAAYVLSPLGAERFVDAYWPGGVLAAANGEMSVPPLRGEFDLNGKGCLRADWMLYEGRPAPTYVATMPLFLYGAGTSSAGQLSQHSGVQIASVRHVLMLFYGFTAAEARIVTRQNSPQAMARGWKRALARRRRGE